MNKPLIDLMLEFQNSLVSRDFVIDYFADAYLVTRDEAISTKMIRPGKLFTEQDGLYVVVKGSPTDGIIEYRKINITQRELSSRSYKLSFYDTMTLKTGMIANHTGVDIETTLGVFILNHNVLVKSFGATIPYINGSWNISKIEDQIAAVAIDGHITASQIHRYIDNVYMLSSYADFCVPALSEKAITSNPKVDALRAKLFAKHKDQLTDVNTMIQIEKELIDLDKDLLKDDSSNGFLINDSQFSTERKRMFITMGMIETFGENPPSFNFSKNSLNEGWDPNDLNILANDIRKGSYSRGKSTALGGAESKFLGRTFQESKIVANDCGTRRGMTTVITENNKHNFVNRNILVGNKTIELTEETIDSYINKTVQVRSPMYCISKDGYCFACFDTRLKRIGIKLLNVLPINISSAMLSASMKKMHVASTTTFSLSDLNEFVI